MALTDNIIAYYKFDNGALTTDSAGSFTLTNNNSVAGTASGKIGYGADFTASNTNKNLSVAGNLGINGGNVTIALWVNLYSIQAFAFPLTLNSSVADVAYSFKIESSGIKFVRNRNGISEDQTTVQLLSATTWYYVVLTYDGSTVRGYVNAGTPQTVASSGSGGGSGMPSLFSISSGQDGGSGNPNYFCDAIIDEVGVWSRALSAGEITSLYNGGSGLQYPFASPNGNFLTFM